MGILDKFTKTPSPLSLGGAKPTEFGAFQHVKSSGKGLYVDKNQSQLDLDGVVPSNNYRNNAPEGKTF